ncbi:LPS-assembly protein LptD [Gammaproteobacteria bacterium]
MSRFRFIAIILTYLLAVSSAAEEAGIIAHDPGLEIDTERCSGEIITQPETLSTVSVNSSQEGDGAFANGNTRSEDPLPFSVALPATAATAPSVPFPLAAATSRRKGDIDWSFCPDAVTRRPPSIADQPLDRQAPIDINSDHATVYEQDTAVLWGHVRLAHPGELLETPWLLYDLSLDIAQAQYGLRYRRGGLILEGKEGFFDLEYSRGVMEAARYYLPVRHAYGTATTVRVDDRTHSHYTDATYSTCPKGQEDWILRAQTLDLDQTRNQGAGYNVTTYFKGVPLFYTPYISFPLSGKRESGLLIPSVGTSARSGLDLRIPYYWNIAPNYDATLTTRILTQRGIQFDTEFRYLTPRSNGQVDLEYLPSDQVYGKERSLLSLHHVGEISPRTHSDITFGVTSDNNYFHDLGNTLTLTSLSYLERRADLTYMGDNWSGLGRVQGFQTLDESRPFERLPQLQITFNSPDRPGREQYTAIGEVSNFYRSTIANGSATNQNYTGTRLWLQPSIAYPLTGLSGFFTPRLTLHHVDYTLTDTAPGLPSGPSLTLPIFSVDAGLFLERNITFGGRDLVQTLEPRFYYLYVPYRNQNNLPIFDTTLLDFSFGQLFRENRFSGPDRVGDANQLAIGVTSRFLDTTTGTQLLYGSLGEILYLRDRLVTLDYGATSTIANGGGATGRSDVVAEVGARLGKYWTGSSTVQWNQQQGQPEKRTLRLRYQSDRDRIVNISFRNRRDLLEQTDLSAVWPMGRQWRAVARWNYSIKDSQTLESFAGVRYDTCCWALQFVARRYVNLPGEAPQSDVMLQLELKGLANIGEKLDPLLTNSIFGYVPTH